uniref:hypothetical protein n=1 Tax=Candidatus Enterococcus willemsii TaxID=1857215 RepID=UPI00403F1833
MKRYESAMIAEPYRYSPAITWQNDCQIIMDYIRNRLLNLVGVSETNYCSVLVQDSRQFCLASFLTSIEGKLLICEEQDDCRIAHLVKEQAMPHCSYSFHDIPEVTEIEQVLRADATISAFVMNYTEDTAAMLPRMLEIAQFVKDHQLTFILETSVNLEEIYLPMADLGVDLLVSSEVKETTMLPEVGFMICKQSMLASII